LDTPDEAEGDTDQEEDTATATTSRGRTTPAPPTDGERDPTAQKKKKKKATTGGARAATRAAKALQHTPSPHQMLEYFQIRKKKPSARETHGEDDAEGASPQLTKKKK
jgi:hypothetical protein